MCTSKYKITIPEPCHEDWAQMTPEQQGRFCGVCSKTVVDFSNKSDQEVDAIIEEKKGEKVCGRFRVDQVAAPVTLNIPPFVAVKTMSLKKLFAIAAFLVFGTGLFSCQSNQGELVGKIAITGDISVEPITTTLPVQDTTGVLTLTGDTISEVIEIENHIKGEMVMPPEIYALGGPRFVENPSYVPEPPVTCIKIDTLEPIHLVAGMMVVNDGIELVEPVPTDTVFTEITIQDIPEDEEEIMPEVVAPLELIAFPNPTNGRMTISYELSSPADASMIVFDITGKKRKELFDIKGLYNGKYTLSTDLSELPSGTYFLVFTAGEQRKTLKVLLQK